MRRYKTLREMTDKQVVDRVLGDYEEFKAHKLDDHTRANRYLNIYKALDNPDTRIEEGTGKLEADTELFSNTYMPIGAAIVDALICNLYNNFFSTEEYLKIGTDNVFDWLASLKVSAHLMKRHREMKFRHLIYRTLLQAACFDYAITGVRWRLEEGHVQVKKRENVVEQFGRIKTTREKVYMKPEWRPDVIDRSDVFGLNYFNCYHDPHTEDVSADPFDGCTAFIDTRQEKIEDLKMRMKTKDREFGKYKNIQQVIAQYMKEQGDAQTESEAAKKDSSIYNTRRIEIIRYWTRDHVVEIAMDKVIWRKNISGIPLQRWCIYDLPSGFPGMGVLQRIERNQYDINASINNRRDFENMVTDPIAVIDESLLGASGEPKLYRGKIFVSKGGDTKSKLHIHTPGTNLAPQMGQDVANQFDMIEKVTMSDNTLGAFKGGRRTARETDEVAQGTANKTTRMALSMEEICLVDIYMHQFLYEQALLSREDSFHHYGKHGDLSVVIKPSDYAFDNQPVFYAVGTSHSAKSPVEVSQFMSAVQMLATLPQLAENNDWNAIKLAMLEMLVPKHMESFVKSSGEPKPNIPPNIENRMFAQGQKVDISPANNDPQHIQVHEAIKTTPDYRIWPEQFKLNHQTHINEHKSAESIGASMSNGGGFDFSSIGGRQDGSDMFRGIRGASIGAGNAG